MNVGIGRFGHGDAGNFLHACRMCARIAIFRFPPASDGQQHFAGSPFDGIDGDDIHIAMEPPMLKSVIENKDISELLLFRNQSGLVSIGADDDRNISEPCVSSGTVHRPILPTSADRTRRS